MRPLSICLPILLFVSPALVAQPPLQLTPSGEAGDNPNVPITKIVLNPAKATMPALKYPLLPAARDMRAGNASVFYQRSQAGEWWNNLHANRNVDKTYDLLEIPLEKMPRDKADFLRRFGALHEIDLAARCDQCDWQMLDRVRQEGFGMTVPDLQGFRVSGAFLAVRTRMEILDRKYDKAVFSLQSGFAMGRHIADGPTLINALVGTSLCQITAARVEEFCQMPDAPSLFWSLVDMPRPFIDMRRALAGERLMMEGLFSEIRDALNDPKAPPASIPAMLKAADRLSAWGLGKVDSARNFNRPLLAMMAAKAYPDARKFLLSQGWAEEDIERMPVLQVALMHDLADYDRAFDDSLKWFNLPYAQAQRGMLKAMAERLKQRRQNHPLQQLANQTVPSLHKILESRIRLDRRLAALQILEALRLYAGENDGKLPRSLADIKDLPLPLDPVTGKAFEYTFENGKGILNAAPSGPFAFDQLAFRRSFPRYEITIATTAPKK